MARSKLTELPEAFAVFPLSGALLLPGGRLPLNIFEPRYLALVEDSMANGRMFGMVQPDRRLSEGDTGPGLFRIGCLGRIAEFNETDDGRYLLTLAGLIRFTIVEEIEPQRGYRRVQAALSTYAADLEEPEAGLPFERDTLLEALRRYFAQSGIDANWQAIGAMSDDALVVSLCMACPFDATEKQALLEVSGADRARTLLALLQINAFGDGRDDTSKAS